jgi:TonB family protein
MNAYLNYFIEANLSLALFLAAYVLILQNETDFRLQRIFLLAGIFISLVFPLLHLRFNGPSLPSLSQIMPSYLLPEIIISANGENTSEAPSAIVKSGWFYIQLLYVAGLTFFLIRFFVRFMDLIRLLTKAKPANSGKLKIIETTDTVPIFSFFNFIVVGQAHALSLEEKQKVIQHEATHVNQLHSLDILLINILSIFFWFNPLLKNYKKIFVQLHEFEADARAVEDRDVNEYCSLLAKVALESAGFKLANHFNNSLTLKRIQMMKTIKRKIRPWKMLMIAGVIPITFFIIACQDQITNEMADIAQSSTMALDIPQEVQEQYDILVKANPGKKFLLMETDENMEPKVAEMKAKLESLDQSQIAHINLLTPTVKPSETPRTFAVIEYTDEVDKIIDKIGDRSELDSDVYNIVEDTATPQGGMTEFYKHVASHLLYPAQARRLGIEGKVFVEFVVQTDGTIIDAKVKNGIGAGCDEAALNVITSSPKWNPGRNKGVAVKQRLVLPISFALN